MKRAGLILFLLAMPAALALWGQQNAPEHPTQPTITFDRLWESYKPQNVDITVPSPGWPRCPPPNPFTPPDQTGAYPDSLLEFTLSTRNQERLFRDAREANYF